MPDTCRSKRCKAAARGASGAALLWLLATAPALGETPPERRNWFNDPFFQVSADIPGCPVPLGPYVTEAESKVQSHHRAERGTTCWLAGQCDRPTAYAYDPDIALALRQAVAQAAPVASSSLWVTVQGRVVYIEGCVRDAAVAPALEAWAQRVPYVLQVVAMVFADLSTQPPYAIATPGADVTPAHRGH